MTNRFLLGIVLINFILVYETSGQASVGARCAFKPEETSNVGKDRLFINTTWQMCLNFACLDAGVINTAEGQGTTIANGTGIRSIGAYDYLEHQRAQGSFHLGILETPTKEFDQEKEYPGAYEIEAYPLTYKNGPLFGWFHLRLTQLGNRNWVRPNGQTFQRDIQWFLTQAQMNSTKTAYKRNHIFGEFDYGDFQGDCSSSAVGYGTDMKLSRTNLKPCLSAQNPSPLMSQAFAWNAEAESELNLGIRQARFNWRLNFPLCPVFYGGSNIDNGIIFRTFVQGNMSMPLDTSYPGTTYRGRMALTGVIGLKDYVSGGHDPAPPPSASPSCVQKCYEKPPPWVDSCSEKKELFWGETVATNNFYLGQTCTSMIDKAYTSGGSKRRFYGRCDLSSDAKPTPAPSLTYVCTTTSPFYEGLETHSAYVAGMKAYQQMLCMNCSGIKPKPPPPPPGAINSTLELNKIYQGVIICHGICMTMATMLTVPLGNYIARYFKETFVALRILQIHVWYQLHTQLNCISLVLLIAGWIFARNVSGSWTTDTFVKLHTRIGRLSIITFVFVFLISGIRTNRCRLLNCTVAVHTIGGYVCLLLFLTVYLLTLPIKSSLVPPTSLHSPGMLASVKTAWVLLGTFGVWVLFTLVCNIESSFLIRSKDKTSGVEGSREWVLRFIPLPTIPFDKEEDSDGTGNRIVRGGIFMIVSIVATLLIIVTMSKHHFETF